VCRLAHRRRRMGRGTASPGQLGASGSGVSCHVRLGLLLLLAL
jgi:hypothetical protein